MENFTDLERGFLDEKSFGDLFAIGFDIARCGSMEAIAHGDIGLNSLSILEKVFTDKEIVGSLIEYLNAHIPKEPLTGAELEELLSEIPFECKELQGNDYGLACGYIVGKVGEDADGDE